jgi:RNA polymerase-binding protein DksA
MKKQVEARRELLLQRKAALLKMWRENASTDQELRAAIEPDWRDRAANVEVSTALHALSEVERRELEEVERALKRIEGGDDGRCVECGEPIGRGRLRALPHATTCVECSAAQPASHPS